MQQHCPANVRFPWQGLILRPSTVTAKTSLMDAIVLLNQASVHDVGGIVILSGLQPIGLLTPQHALRAVASGVDLTMLSVAEVMERSLTTVQMDEIYDVVTLFHLFERHTIQHLFVVDQQQFLGIISLQRLQRWMSSRVAASHNPPVEPTEKLANTEVQALFSAMSDLVIVFDSQGRYLKVLAGRSKLLLPNADKRNKTLHDAFPKETADILLNSIQQCLTTQKTINVEYSLMLNQQAFWSDTSISPIDANTVILVARDITERKHVEQQLKASVLEKELLLKEVHHRVKNNLQIISSIFSLQSQHTADPNLVEILTASQHRIRSIALIHEKLYLSQSLRHISFADYIQDLTKNLFSTYSARPNLIQLHLDVVNISINIDTAIPCGLLVNELVSNCFKHAFPNARSGAINVNFSINAEEQLCLMVQDDGVGLLENWNRDQVHSLGFRLIRALTRQLKGNLEIYNDHGTTVKVTFPPPPLLQPASSL